MVLRLDLCFKYVFLFGTLFSLCWRNFGAVCPRLDKQCSMSFVLLCNFSGRAVPVSPQNLMKN
jgi:hypothetical protein